MLYSIRLITALWSILLLVGCSTSLSDQLIGDWQGVVVYEDEVELGIDPQEVNLQFGSDGSYSFRSTLNHEQKGRYELNEAIYIDFFENNSAPANRVAAQLIHRDTLEIEMMEGDRERVLILSRRR